NAMSVMNTVTYLLTTAVAALMVGLVRAGVLATPDHQLWFLVLVVALGAALAWRLLFTQTLELVLEWVLWPVYRIRAHGPGAGCVLIFPEAILRRKEDQLLRQFGQGVWHILRAVPDTPVVVFWIEGGWGSFASYKGGPPMKNKRLDWWRRIDLAVTEPQVLDP